MNKKTLCLTALVAFLAALPLHAHEGATGVVKERMDVMKGIRDDMKPLRRMIRGRADYDQGEFLERVQSIKAVSADIPALFPEGSLQKPSEALPAIWENWDDFSTQAAQFHERVIALESAVQGNDMNQIRSNFRSVAQTCKACHDDYQKD